MIPDPDFQTKEIDICAAYHNAPDALIEILHDVQAVFGFISSESIIAIAEALNLTRAEVHGVVSFYDDFTTSEPEKLIIKICRGEACQSMGANALLARIKRFAAGKSIGVEAVYCLGNCALAPAALIGPVLHGRLNEEKLDDAVGSAHQ